MKTKKTTYKPLLNLRETEQAIDFIKDFFPHRLGKSLNLFRVTAPLFVLDGTGINDDLNGIERPVSFPVKDMNNQKAVVVHSLAKWKRMALAQYGCQPGEGIYTDMNAIRADETLDAIHSIYVDQWDWERVMTAQDRTIDFLKSIVTSIYEAIKGTESALAEKYPSLSRILPEILQFLHTQDLEDLYPDLSPKEREYEACKKYGAIFLIGIGANLKSGKPHDKRASDYDDWSTPTDTSHKGLNGDILVWHPVLEDAFELSSMGIRVDKNALEKQLKISGTEDRKSLLFHRMVLEDRLPLSIGGGIGQSRLCMFFLRKAHIGEVQASIWPSSMIEECKERNIELL